MLLALVLQAYSLVAATQLSENAEVSVLTAAPGEKLFEAFGHSAILVNDPDNGIAQVFNYGIFDFGPSPLKFYFNFAKGDLYYVLGVQSLRRFTIGYVRDDRTLTQQVLNFSPQQKQALYDFLYWNAQPENRTYLYDYFYDNCATRPRDVLIDAADSIIIWNSDHLTEPKSIRDLTDEYLEEKQPWGDLGIDLTMASTINHHASPMEHMFLPDYLMMAIEKAKIKTATGEEPLVKETKIIYQGVPTAGNSTWFTPTLLFGILLLLTLFITWRDIKRGTIALWYDGFWFGVVGFIGVFFVTVWLFTSHYPTQYNLDVAWALPTHFFVAFMLFRKSMRAKLTGYFSITLAILILLLLGWPFWWQQMHFSLIPLLILLGVRAGHYVYFYRKAA